MRKITYIQAINEAMHEEMARDESVFVIGEDVDMFGGVFNATEGLMEAFGAKRLRGTPVSESGFTGVAVGAAMTGLRPIVEIMYMDFITCAMDQVVNQMAKLTTMSGGRVKMPVTIRAQAGAGTCESAQHSQSLEAWFVHTPGIKVVMPATVYDAKGLLKSAIRDDQPVIFIESRNLYYQKEEVPEGEWIVPIGKADLVKQGTDLTLIAPGYVRRRALAAAQSLDGTVDVELIDPRSVDPLDMATIIASVEKTGRVLVVHEAPAKAGIGAEIVRRVVDQAYDSLHVAPQVLGGADLPMPFSVDLERACLPQEEDIKNKILGMTRGK